jgi:hypothetical protein
MQSSDGRSLASQGDYWMWASTSAFGSPNYENTSVGAQFSVVVSNSLGTTSAGPWTIRMLLPGMVAVWGDDSLGACERPASLTNAAVVAAGGQHCLAARDDGSVLAWGGNGSGQTNVPAGLTNAIAVAAGTNHSLALKADGTVLAWGTNNYGQTTVPTGLNGVAAIAAAANQSLALRTNGAVVAWGQTNGPTPASLTNAAAIAAGETFCLALISNGTVVAWGQNGSGQTNVPANLTNAVAIAAGGSHALALRADGTVTAWGANGSGQINVPAGVSNFIAVAAGTAHSLARKNDGTTVAWGDNTFGQCNVQVTNTLVKLIAAGANHSMVAAFSPLVQYPINVTQDLLLVYNPATADGSSVFAYYLANRPMVAGANVLALTNCPATYSITRTNFTTAIKDPLSNWLTANPTKRPQYMVMFVDVPVRINGYTNAWSYWVSNADNSVSYEIYSTSVGIPPFITHINMRDWYTTNAAPCTNYINKLRYFGTNYSPGHLLISASSGGYPAGSYVLDDVHHGGSYTTNGSGDLEAGLPLTWVTNAVPNLLQSGIPTGAILYTNGWDETTNGTVFLGPHLTNIANVAGYVCWGAHSALQNEYPLSYSNDGSLLVKWHGASGWWPIDTIESFNGLPYAGQGDYWMWFSTNAFGSTNYENTPVGAITHTDEPGSSLNYPYPYLGLWAAGKNFAICAWNTCRTPYFQAVGDPFVTR